MAIHPQTRIGHVHLTVSDLDRAVAFYRDVLGFEVTTTYGRDAVFLSAGGYHHHIGLNTWAGRGAPAPAPGTTGLYHFAILFPDRKSLATTVPRAGRRRQTRRRIRPRRERSDLSAGPRRQRSRAVPRSAGERVAEGSRREARDVDAATGSGEAAVGERVKWERGEGRGTFRCTVTNLSPLPSPIFLSLSLPLHQQAVAHLHRFHWRRCRTRAPRDELREVRELVGRNGHHR